jgi:hypothetical protein
MGRVSLITVSLFVSLTLGTAPLSAATNLTAADVPNAPVIDGVGDEPLWSAAEGITVKDGRRGDEISLKAVTHGTMIYFLVSFPDGEENVLHKPWVWDREMKIYKLGPQREDGFTFKWSMSGNDVDLSNFSDDDYKADVWYWKANRTNPAGYADDKHHVLASDPGKKAKELKGKGGSTRYLMRIGDAGTAAQKKQVFTAYHKDVMPQYVQQKPAGSRADVRAKGLWLDGVWTVEFGRPLATGYDDDVQFEPGKGSSYLFGVSIYGLYGDDLDDGKPHLYGQGRISKPLTLVLP